MAVQQIPDGGWISPDGRWLWRDSQWHPIPEGESSGLFWFTSSPRWIQTLLIMGLIGLIPFVGAMNVYGFAIVTAKNLRAGYRVLPPAGFAYLGIGAPVLVLGLAWGAIAFLLMLVMGSAVGFAEYGQAHSVVWAIALGAASGLTVAGIASIPTVPLLVPALEMSEREGWGIFRINQLVRHATTHWRSTWYGTAIYILWYLLYLAMVLVLSVIPFGSLLAAVAAVPALAPMVAVPIARFNDPPARFGNGAANALAIGWLAAWLIGIAVPWAVGLTAASVISAHPDEVACVFAPGCSVQYSGNLEVITRGRHNAQDPTLVTIEVTYTNRSSSHVAVDPSEYSARTTSGEVLSPSPDCAAPEAATVSPGERLSQTVCFRVPSAGVSLEVHVPWVGWTSRLY